MVLLGDPILEDFGRVKDMVEMDICSEAVGLRGYFPAKARCQYFEIDLSIDQTLLSYKTRSMIIRCIFINL